MALTQARTITKKKEGDRVSEYKGRMIGRAVLPNGEEICVNQVQHATATDYEIQDKDKRAEFERKKAEQSK